MSSQLRSIFRRLSDTPINILCFVFDGFFERQLAELGYNVYIPVMTGEFPSFKSSHENLHILTQNLTDIPLSCEFDCIIINDKISQYAKAAEIAKFWNIPLILVEHYYKLDGIKNEDLLILQNQKYFSVVETHENLAQSWYNKAQHLIPYFIEVTNKPKNDNTIIYGNFQQSETRVLQELSSKIKNLKVYGEKLSTHKVASYEELLNEISSCKTYINLATSQKFSIPMLHAMGAGCRVVSNLSNATNVLKDRILVGGSVEEIIQLTNAPYRNNQDFITENYSFNRFSMWKEIINSTKDYIWK